MLRKGETRFTTGTTPTTWRFTGQREDATIGLYFYNARYLDPQMGRFTQPDTIVPEPAGPQSLNRYSYANNNSLKYTDPSGHRACAECVGGGGGGGAILVAGAAGGASLFSQAVQALNVAMADAQVFLQSLAQPFGNQLPALVDQVSQAGQASQPASSNAGNTAPGNLDPNNWDPNRFKFKSSSSLRSHFKDHVLDAADETWEDVLGVSRSQLEAARSDPSQIAQLQDAYLQIGQQTSRASNYIGMQAQGQRVFVDTTDKVVSIVQGDRFLSLYRVSASTWREFVLSMQDKGLQFTPGLTFDALQKAMGY